MLEYVDRLFNQYKFVRRLLVLWAVFMITWTTWMMFADITDISTAAVTAYATNAALLGTVLGFYQWSRGRDKGEK